MKYFLGIDVGSSKTYALMVDETGHCMGFGKACSGNHQNVGYEGLEHVLVESFEGALSMSGVGRASIAGAGFGVAGYDFPSDRAGHLQAISKLGLPCPIEVVNDGMNGLLAGATRGIGVNVTAGPTALWTQQQAELTRILEKTIEELNRVSRGYTPRVMEVRFGMGQPSLMLQTEIGEIRLHGYIDRLDTAPDGTVRVIDYKAGNAPISASHLKEGRGLQLPIYALAARDALGLGEVSSGFYWHIQKAEASSLKLEKFEGGVNGAFETAVAHVVKHVANIRAGHFEPKPPEEGCPSYCPAVDSVGDIRKHIDYTIRTFL